MYVQPVTDSEQHLPLYTIDSKVPQVFSLLTVEQFEVQALLCFVPLKSFDSHRRLAFGSLVLVLVLGHAIPRPFRVAASTWRRGSTHGRLVTQQYSDDLPCGQGFGLLVWVGPQCGLVWSTVATRPLHSMGNCVVWTHLVLPRISHCVSTRHHRIICTSVLSRTCCRAS
jgi:hypothetical protein